MASIFRDPKTKSEVIDRLLSFDFPGDIRRIGEFPARLRRTSARSFTLTFPKTGRTYEFLVKIPRPTEKHLPPAKGSEAEDDKEEF